MKSRRFLLDPSRVAAVCATAGVLIVGISAEFVDFRALRAPIVLAVGLCVLGTAVLLVKQRSSTADRASHEGGHAGPPLHGASSARDAYEEGGHTGPPLRQASSQLAEFVRTTVVGAGIWGAGGALYAIIHAARGEAFDAARFGPQWAQALGLIGVHALFLGMPTGITAAVVLYAVQRRRGTPTTVVAANESA